MKRNRMIKGVVCALLTVTAVLSISVCTAFAKEKEIFSDDMVDTYKDGGLQTNWYGKLDQNKRYSDCEVWGTTYGAGDWCFDSEDGFTFQIPADATAKQEKYISHLIKPTELPENSTVVTSLEFKIADEPKSADSELWFKLSSEAVDLNLFRIRTKPQSKIELGFASDTSWPFTDRSFDRSKGMSVEYGKSYRLDLTMEPYDGAYRFAAELYSDSGEKIGSGIVEQYGILDSKSFVKPSAVCLVAVANKEVNEPEPFITLKHISVKARYDEELKAKFTPENGATDVDPSGRFFVSFDGETDGITAENVTVSGGAVVRDVVMNDNGSDAEIVLSGLKQGTGYTVKIQNVISNGKTYNFDWSFVTKMQVSFSDFRFSSIGSENVSIDFSAMNSENITADADNAGYIGGEKVLVSDATEFEKVCGFGVSGLEFLGSAGKKGITLKKRIKMPNADGKNITLEMNFDPGEGRWDKYARGITSLSSTTDSSAKIGVMKLERSQYSPGATVSILDIGAKDKYAAKKDRLIDSYTLRIEFIKNGEGYDVKATVFDAETGEELLSGLCDNALTAEQLATIDEVTMDFYMEDSGSKSGVLTTYKDIRIFAEEGSDGLTDGKNTLYVSYESSLSEGFDIDFLVVIQDFARRITDLQLVSYRDCTDAEGDLEVPVTLTDAANSTVRIYTMNSIDGMLPYSGETIIHGGGKGE